MNSEIVVPETPNWLQALEEKREKRLKAKLGHEAGAGAPCIKCGDKCPGLDLHFWRKACKICRCPKEEHDVHDDDIYGWAQFQLLGSKPNKIKTKIVLPGKKDEVELEWAPKGHKDTVDKYLKTLPPERLPVKGSQAAQDRKQLLQKQLPIHDIDPTLCHELNEDELKKMEEYIAHVKQNSVGVGQIVNLSSVIKGNLHNIPPQEAAIIATRYPKGVPLSEIVKLQYNIAKNLEKHLKIDEHAAAKNLPNLTPNQTILAQEYSQNPLASLKMKDLTYAGYSTDKQLPNTQYAKGFSKHPVQPGDTKPKPQYHIDETILKSTNFDPSKTPSQFVPKNTNPPFQNRVEIPDQSLPYSTVSDPSKNLYAESNENSTPNSSFSDLIKRFDTPNKQDGNKKSLPQNLQYGYENPLFKNDPNALHYGTTQVNKDQNHTTKNISSALPNYAPNKYNIYTETQQPRVPKSVKDLAFSTYDPSNIDPEQFGDQTNLNTPHDPKLEHNRISDPKVLYSAPYDQKSGQFYPNNTQQTKHNNASNKLPDVPNNNMPYDPNNPTGVPYDLRNVSQLDPNNPDNYDKYNPEHLPYNPTRSQSSLPYDLVRDNNTTLNNKGQSSTPYDSLTSQSSMPYNPSRGQHAYNPPKGQNAMLHDLTKEHSAPYDPSNPYDRSQIHTTMPYDSSRNESSLPYDPTKGTLSFGPTGNQLANYDPSRGERKSYDPARHQNTTPYDPQNPMSYDPSAGQIATPYNPSAVQNTRPYDPSAGQNTRPYGPSADQNTRPYDPSADQNTRPYDPSAGQNTGPYDPSAGQNTIPYDLSAGQNTTPYGPSAGQNTMPYDLSAGQNTIPYDCRSNIPSYDPSVGKSKKPLAQLQPGNRNISEDYLHPNQVNIGLIKDISYPEIRAATEGTNDFFEDYSPESIREILNNIKLPDCHYCKKPFEENEFAVTIDRANVLFHAQCFKCAGCNQSLADNVYFYHKESDNVYCGRDYAKIRGIPRCKACDELIFTKEYCLAENSTFHLKHFCCIECDTPLAGQDYTLEDEMPYCLPCFENSKASKCSSCSRVIKPDEIGCALNGVHFHAVDECFACRVCKKPLMGKKMLLRNEKLYCSHDCFNSVK